MRIHQSTRDLFTSPTGPDAFHVVGPGATSSDRFDTFHAAVRRADELTRTTLELHSVRQGINL